MRLLKIAKISTKNGRELQNRATGQWLCSVVQIILVFSMGTYRVTLTPFIYDDISAITTSIAVKVICANGTVNETLIFTHIKLLRVK